MINSSNDMFTFSALLFIIVFATGRFYRYISGLFYWIWENHTIALANSNLTKRHWHWQASSETPERDDTRRLVIAQYVLTMSLFPHQDIEAMAVGN